MTKRLISLFLCMVMLFSMLTTAVLAAEDVVLSEENVTVEPETTEPEIEDTSEAALGQEGMESIPVEEPEVEMVPEDVEISMESGETENTLSIESLETITPDIPIYDEEDFSSPAAKAYYDYLINNPPKLASESKYVYESAASVTQTGVNVASTYATSSFSWYYRQSSYYQELQEVLGELSGDQKWDMVYIALSQEGYHEGDSESQLGGGNSNGTLNYTEYGSHLNAQGQPWCASFISWCARMAGVDTSVIRKSAWAGTTGLGNFVAYNGNNIDIGDIVSFSGDHVGIVYAKNDTTIYVIEGNKSNAVIREDYPRYNNSITHYYSPDYVTPWVYSNGKWYFYDLDTGEQAFGWHTWRGYTYYFDPSNNGAMLTGWKQMDGQWYYFDSYGAMQTGWEEIGDYWYYFNSSGHMYDDGWLYLNGETYYFNSTGAMLISWQEIDGNWYYFNSDGEMQTGWCKPGSIWFYMDPTTGIMQTGWLYLEDGTYYLSQDESTLGYMLTSWQEIDGNWYYFNSAGKMQTGWCKPGSIWFYMDPTTGIMQTGWLYLEDGTYYLSQNESTLGYMQTGWVKISGNWHYFNSAGRVQTGWKDYDGDRYYLDPNNNGAALTGTHTIDGVEYTFDENGALIG